MQTFNVSLFSSPDGQESSLSWALISLHACLAEIYPRRLLERGSNGFSDPLVFLIDNFCDAETIALLQYSTLIQIGNNWKHDVRSDARIRSR